MTETNAPTGVDDDVQSIDRQVAQTQAAWKAEAQALGKLATAFGPLAKPKTYENLPKLPALLEKVEAKIRPLAVAARGVVVLDEIRADLRERRRRVHERLARDLSAECKAAGLELRVVRREEPIEVRIPPFAVLIDREKGRAELRFARLPIAACEADAAVIVRAHGQSLKAMGQAFQADRFFDACFKAWRAACSTGSGGSGDRIEILDFLPYLALQHQSPAFRVEPIERNFRSYSRARFAYDTLRLRQAGQLTHDGWRMNLGVATGTTATKKNRAIFFEDEHGDGEFKLTVFFTRAEGR